MRTHRPPSPGDFAVVHAPHTSEPITRTNTDGQTNNTSEQLYLSKPHHTHGANLPHSNTPHPPKVVQSEKDTQGRIVYHRKQHELSLVDTRTPNDTSRFYKLTDVQTKGRHTMGLYDFLTKYNLRYNDFTKMIYDLRGFVDGFNPDNIIKQTDGLYNPIEYQKIAGQIQTPMDELIDRLADMMDTINGCCFEIEQTIAPQIQNKELQEHLIAENSDLDHQGTILEELIAKYGRKTI